MTIWFNQLMVTFYPETGSSGTKSDFAFMQLATERVYLLSGGPFVEMHHGTVNNLSKFMITRPPPMKRTSGVLLSSNNFILAD